MRQKLLSTNHFAFGRKNAATPATSAIGGTMYGNRVRNSTIGRALGTFRWTSNAVGMSSARVSSTVPTASSRLSESVGHNRGSLNAVRRLPKDHLSNTFDQVKRIVGTFWNE
jgi:hypothetical protein